MPTFSYTGDDARQFPADDGINQSVEVEPGDTVELDHNPHPGYFDDGGGGEIDSAPVDEIDEASQPAETTEE